MLIFLPSSLVQDNIKDVKYATGILRSKHDVIDLIKSMTS